MRPRFADSVADAALLVANNDEGGKPEATAALHNLCHAVDMDQTIDELAVNRIPALTIATATASFSLTSHVFFFSLAREDHPARSLRILSDQNARPPSRAPSASALTRP